MRRGRGGKKIERWAVALGDLEDRGLPADMWKRYRKGDRFWVEEEADAEHYWADMADGLNPAKIRQDAVVLEQPYGDSRGASSVPSHSGGAGEKRLADSPPAADVRVHKAQAQAVLLRSAPAAATVGQHATEGDHVPLHPSAQPSSAGPAKLAPAQRKPAAASQASPLAAGPAGSGGGAFGAQHLAHVLCAAFPSMRAMTRLVQDVKAKSDAFRPVHLSSQANGGAYTREQIATRIADCRPPQVDSNAGALLSWLVKEKVLKKEDLHTAMVTFNIKHVSRDTVDGLVSKIVTLWPQAGPGETERGQKGGGACRGQVQVCADAASSAAPRSQLPASASSRESGGAALVSSSSGCALALSGPSHAAGNQAVDAALQAFFDARGLGAKCAGICHQLGVTLIDDLALVDPHHVKNLKLLPVEEKKLLGITGPSACTPAGAASRAKVTHLNPNCCDPGLIDPHFERCAFLIGNGEYSDPQDRLFQPERDAQAMGEALRGHGFDAHVFKNQKKRETKDRLREWQDQLPATCVALLYCAGHGCEMDGENFFMPTDAPSSIFSKADAEDGCVSLAWMINSTLARLTRESLVIVLLDCCRVNPIKARGMRSRGARGGQGGLAEVKLSDPTEARLFVGYAAGPGLQALEGNSQNGFFTQALLKVLRSDLAREDIRAKFFGSVSDFVGQISGQKQRPEVRQNMNKGFVFKQEHA